MQKKYFSFQELETLIQDQVLMLIDDRGKIIDRACNNASELSIYLFDALQRTSHIQDAFQISSQDLQNLLIDKTIKSFDDKPNFFQWDGRLVELYSLLASIKVRLFPTLDNQYVAQIYATDHYLKISTIPCHIPVFCVNEQEKIVAYNGSFKKQIAAGQEPGSILNCPLKQFLEPTPEQEAQTVLSSFAIPAFETTFDLFSSIKSDISANIILPPNIHFEKAFIEWESIGNESAFLSFKNTFDWSKHDIRIDIEIVDSTNGPPCLILGDPVTPGITYFDREGYLFGTQYSGYGFVLKKRGELHKIVDIEPDMMKSGIYTYLKVQDNLFIYHNNRQILAFHDQSAIQRHTGNLLLYLRQGYHCRISGLRMGIHKRTAPDTIRNQIVSIKDSPGKFYHLTPAYTYERKKPLEIFTGYQLFDFSDLKQNMNDLENAYQKNLLQATEADERLKRYAIGNRFLIGESKALRKVKEQAERLAASDATVLIEGATGTGKEMMAQYIHAISKRDKGPFLKLDCSTLPASLIESALFGHEKGSFTGATSRFRGLFEQADGGTLFIDEAGNLTLDIQAKLLQFLENRTFTPIGGSVNITVDVRIIVASNVSLYELVHGGTFRGDLYHRIAVFVITMPELKSRMEDIPALTAHFLNELNRRYKKGIHKLSPETYKSISMYDWPGNIREYKNVLERTYFFAEGDEILELNMNIDTTKSERTLSSRKKRKTSSFLLEDTDLLYKTTMKHKGNLKATATALDISIRSLYTFMKKHNITPLQLRNTSKSINQNSESL